MKTLIFILILFAFIFYPLVLNASQSQLIPSEKAYWVQYFTYHFEIIRAKILILQQQLDLLIKAGLK